MTDEFRRVLLAISLSMLVFLGFNAIWGPKPQEGAQNPENPSGQAVSTTAANTGSSSADVDLSLSASQNKTQLLPREDIIAKGNRIDFSNGKVEGSVNLTGAIFDDLLLSHYNIELNGQEKVALLSPENTIDGSERFFIGWIATDGETKTPNLSSIWQAESNELTPDSPLTLRWDNGADVTFVQEISLDENYVFNINAYVINQSDKAVTFRQYAQVASFGEKDKGRYYSGAIGRLDGSNYRKKFGKMEDDFHEVFPAKSSKKDEETQSLNGGWIGFTEHYWLTSLMMDNSVLGQAWVKNLTDNNNREGWQAVYLKNEQTAASGVQTEPSSNLFFSGAKELDVINAVMENHNIDLFNRSIDFGTFYVITKPLYSVLTWLNQKLGNMGLAIIALTVIVKIILLPLAWKSFKSMAKMKTLQPKMMALKEQYGDDRQAMQKATMELYKKEKVNPAAGCIPLLIQIPIFFSLYKVLMISIELRHAPFFGWIKDLSVADPTSIFNLFGLIPWWSGQPSDWGFGLGILSVAALGIWPIIMGFTMYLQQTLNPTPADKQQAMIFKWLPVVFTFMMGQFAAGLVIYWTANNILSFVQQWFITRSTAQASQEAKA